MKAGHSKLKNKILPNSNTIIYIHVEPSTNLLNGSGINGIGEAPELSPIYAEYDDGFAVFNYYNNFQGTNTGDCLSASVGSKSFVKIDNGVTISQQNGYISGIICGVWTSPSSQISEILLSDESSNKGQAMVLTAIGIPHHSAIG